MSARALARSVLRPAERRAASKLAEGLARRTKRRAAPKRAGIPSGDRLAYSPGEGLH